MSVTNAIGTCRQKESGWAEAGPPGGFGGVPPFQGTPAGAGSFKPLFKTILSYVSSGNDF